MNMIRGLFAILLQKEKDVCTTKIRPCKRKVCEGSQGGRLVKKLLDLNIDLLDLGMHPALCLLSGHSFHIRFRERGDRQFRLTSIPRSEKLMKVIHSFASRKLQPS